MKLRNKKTGEIIEYDEEVIYYRKLTSNGHEDWTPYHPEDWEDYTPAEPLIKDEKVRKAVRAWAKINNFAKVKLLVSPEYGSQFEGGYGFSRITFSGITLEYLDYPKEYTIAELCGEEEE